MSSSLLLRLLSWAYAAVLLLLALHVKTPDLWWLRSSELPLVLLGTALGLVALRHGLRGPLGQIGPGRWRETLLLALLLIAASGMAGVTEMRFRLARAAVLRADTPARSLGAHFIVGYTNFDEVAMLAERGLIGGVYLTARNVRGKSVAQIHDEVAALQARRAAAQLPPLLVAADQEGGSVAHMTPPLPAMPSLNEALHNRPQADQGAQAYAYGVEQGRGLAALGINLNFGPVADLVPSAGPLAHDAHTHIERRAISGDAATVAHITHAYGAGLLAVGVRPTYKHFPGLGRVKVDTHDTLGVVDAPARELAETDWRPFRDLPEGAALMLGHVVADALDPQRPASQSPVVVDWLRKQWGFRGLLVTDDLNMGAVYRQGICPATLSALQAGVDLLLISWDPDQYYFAMHCAAARLAAGQLDTRAMTNRYRQVRAMSGLLSEG